MKSILKKDRILVFVALLGLLASLVPLAARTKAEQSNRYYDYILDYSSLRYMASQSTRSEGEWLELFASLGIRKVTVAEATALGLFQSIIGLILVLLSDFIAKRLGEDGLI